jgi:UDP-GlcNAc:undecaprenyl-phosphate GlcNAc-1-phosphate transferase
VASYVLGFGLSLVISLLLTRFVRDVAVRKGWQSAPTEQRHVHRNAIPRFGGVAVYIALLGTMATLFFYIALRRGVAPEPKLFALFVPASIVFLLGLFDDARSLSARTKFLVQIVAASIVYAMGLRISTVGLLKAGEFRALLSFPLTVGWILLITNAFNLIDGLDGLAAGSALFSTLVLFIVALLGHSIWIALFSISLAGAILGFLYFNFNPASIFLGDCGSLFIGFTLAVLSLASSEKAPTMVAVGIPVVCFGLPILDVAMSVFRRFLSGRSLFKADGEHIHHRLIRNGLSHRTAVLVLYGMTACFGLLSLALLHRDGVLLALVLGVIGCGVVLFVGHLGYHEVDEIRRIAFRTVTQRQVIAHNLRFRRSGEALLKCTSLSEIEGVLVETFENSPFDMFELRWPVQFEIRSAGPSIAPARGEVQPWSYRWEKQPEPKNDIPAWRLDLSLADASMERCGSLTVGRYAIGHPLPMDINLLTEDFHFALAKALVNCAWNYEPATLGPNVIALQEPRRYISASGD